MWTQAEHRPGHPLAALAEEEIVRRAAAGDRQATEYLLVRYRRLVELKARGFFVQGADPEDVIQEGMIGLYKAICSYRAERLSGFRAFAELCISRQIISAVKSAAREKHRPLNAYVSLSGGAGIEDAIGVEYRSEPRELLAAVLEGAMPRELSGLEGRVLRLRLEGKTYDQVAVELGCGRKTVDNAVQRARRKLARWIEECR